jgi:hypothetical protein
MGAQKRRRDRRAETPKRMQLTERDIAIVEGVHRFRVLRQDQIQRLFFGPRNKSGAQRRLERLYDHGFLERRFLPVSVGRSPTLYVLDRKGVELLRVARGYDELVWYGSSKQLKTDFLEHTLAINEVMVTVTLACRQLGYVLETWLTENQLKAQIDRVTVTAGGRRESVPVVPDSFFTVLAHQRRYPFFLELDRGTMTLARFKTKVQGYVAYYRSGAYEQRYGLRSMRVLTVTLGEGRLTNLKAATEEAGGREWFWFALLGDLSPETVLSAPVWWVATRDDRAPLIRPVQA